MGDPETLVGRWQQLPWPGNSYWGLSFPLTSLCEKWEKYRSATNSASLVPVTFTDDFYHCILIVNIYRTDYKRWITCNSYSSINEKDSRVAFQCELQRQSHRCLDRNTVTVTFRPIEVQTNGDSKQMATVGPMSSAYSIGQRSVTGKVLLYFVCPWWRRRCFPYSDRPAVTPLALSLLPGCLLLTGDKTILVIKSLEQKYRQSLPSNNLSFNRILRL